MSIEVNLFANWLPSLLMWKICQRIWANCPNQKCDMLFKYQGAVCFKLCYPPKFGIGFCPKIMTLVFFISPPMSMRYQLASLITGALGKFCWNPQLRENNTILIKKFREIDELSNWTNFAYSKEIILTELASWCALDTLKTSMLQRYYENFDWWDFDQKAQQRPKVAEHSCGSEPNDKCLPNRLVRV